MAYNPYAGVAEYYMAKKKLDKMSKGKAASAVAGLSTKNTKSAMMRKVMNEKFGTGWETKSALKKKASYLTKKAASTSAAAAKAKSIGGAAGKATAKGIAKKATVYKKRAASVTARTKPGGSARPNAAK